MKSNKLLFAAAISTILTAGSHSVLADDTGWYAGISANRLSADQRDIDDVSFEDSDTALGLKGGYMFTDMFGVELGYLDLGDYRTEANSRGINLRFDADAFTLAGVVNFSLGESWDLYGKLGVAMFDSDTGLEIDESDTRAFGGIGAELDLGSFNIFGEYDVIDTDVNDLVVDVLSLGVKVEF